MSGPTREQVIQWASDAGFPVMGPARADAAERFAALAYAAGKAAEREVCIEAARTVGGKFSTECEILIRIWNES